MPRHPSFLLKIKINIKQPCSSSLSLSLHLPPSHYLSFFISLSLSLSLPLFSLSLFLSLPPSFSLSFYSLSLFLSDRSERGRERGRGERELHAHTSRKCGHALSIPHSFNQSVCVIYILIPLGILGSTNWRCFTQ